MLTLARKSERAYHQAEKCPHKTVYNQAMPYSLIGRIGLLLLVLVLIPIADADTTLRRTTLLVDDLDRSEEFYLALGLKPFYDVSRSRSDGGGVIGGADLPLAGNPNNSRIVILIGPDQDTGMVGLLAYDDPPLAETRTSIKGLGRDDVVLMFNVDDIQRSHRKLKALGARLHRPPYRYEVKGDDGRVRSTGWRMFAYDPDARLVEIAQPDRARRANANIVRWAEGVIAYRVKSNGHVNGFENWRLDVHPDGSKSMTATVRYQPRPVMRQVFHRVDAAGNPLDTFASYWIDGSWRGNAWYVMEGDRWSGRILSANGTHTHVVEPKQRFAMVPHVLAVDSWRARLFDKSRGGKQAVLGYNMDATALGPNSLQGKLMHYSFEYLGKERLTVPAGDFDTEHYRIEGVVDLYLFGPDSLVAKFVFEEIDREHVLVEYRAEE